MPLSQFCPDGTWPAFHLKNLSGPPDQGVFSSKIVWIGESTLSCATVAPKFGLGTPKQRREPERAYKMDLEAGKVYISVMGNGTTLPGGPVAAL